MRAWTFRREIMKSHNLEPIYSCALLVHNGTTFDLSDVVCSEVLGFGQLLNRETAITSLLAQSLD